MPKHPHHHSLPLTHHLHHHVSDPIDVNIITYIYPILFQNVERVFNYNEEPYFFQMEPPPCVPAGHSAEDHLTHSLDLATTLRSELAALTYKRDRLIHELSETKNVLSVKDNECEALRAQSARQSSLINSLQQRLQTAEGREKSLLARSETTTNTLQRDKRCTEEKNKELCSRVRRLECDLSNEENHSEQLR